MQNEVAGSAEFNSYRVRSNKPTCVEGYGLLPLFKGQ